MEEPRKRSESVRISITLPTEHHDELQVLAKGKRVSLAWVVRDAVERYLADQAPLFRSVARED